MSSFTEAQFAAWMSAWADAVDAAPGWRDLARYRDISAVDCGYLHMYFRVLEQVRKVLDGDSSRRECLGPPQGGSGFLRRAAGRFAETLRTPFRPTTIPLLEGHRTGLIVRAAPNASGFPVLEVLRAELGWQLAFGSWSRTVGPRVRALNIPYFHLGDTYRRSYARLRRKHEADVSQSMARLDRRQLASLFSTIAGVPIEIDFSSVIHEVCCEVRVQTDVYLDLFTRLSPSVLILFNEATLRERPAARVAAQVGVKSVAVQHGLFIGHVYRSLATDRMIVWGRIPREFWLARGCAPEQVISVGAYGHERWNTGRSSREHAGGRSRPPAVVFLGQNPAAFLSPALHRASIDIVVDAARRLPGVRFSIRPHPGESHVPYKAAVRSSGLGNVAIRMGGDLVEALRDADAILTVFSTAGLEAMLLGTPVIVLNPSPEPSLAPYASAAPTAATADALARLIDRILSDALFRKQVNTVCERYAEEYFGPLEGAARRAAVLIDEYAGAAGVRSAGRAQAVRELST